MPVSLIKSFVAAIAFVLMSGTLAHAQTTGLVAEQFEFPHQDGLHATCRAEYDVDRANDTLTIRGIGFGSRAPQV